MEGSGYGRADAAAEAADVMETLSTCSCATQAALNAGATSLPVQLNSSVAACVSKAAHPGRL